VSRQDTPIAHDTTQPLLYSNLPLVRPWRPYTTSLYSRITAHLLRPAVVWAAGSTFPYV